MKETSYSRKKVPQPQRCLSLRATLIAIAIVLLFALGRRIKAV